jgi:NDP-sugar pyrophosphorylase family protein
MIPPAVIIAGGTATRLRPITERIPKAMLPVAGKPFIEHQLSLLRKNGIQKVVICSGYLSRQIEDFVKDGFEFGLKVVFSQDGDKLLGTGGTVKKALHLLQEEFFIMYGDSYLTADFTKIYEYFRNQGKLGLMTVFRNLNAWDNSNIIFHNGRITLYDKENRTPDMTYIDYGLGILRKSAFEPFSNKEIFDLSELYQDIILKDKMAGYEVLERFYEIGSLEGLTETEKYISQRLQQEKNNAQ